MTKSEAFNKKIDLDDEVGIEIKELRSELTKYQTLIQHKSQKREGISPDKLKENDVYYFYNLHPEIRDDKGSKTGTKFYDWMIFEKDNDLLYFWKLIHSFSSLFSSYYYIYVAAFV